MILVTVLCSVSVPVKVQASSDQEVIATSTDAIWGSNINGTPTMMEEKTLNDIYEVLFWILVIVLVWFVIWIFIKIINYLLL